MSLPSLSSDRQLSHRTQKKKDENVAACWEALKPAVGMLQGFYEYALELEAAFPELLSLLCDGEVKLNTMQALAKQLGAVLDFVIRFDHCKMNTPSIQNDFSYYRRSMQRIKANHVDGEVQSRWCSLCLTRVAGFTGR